MKRWAEAREFKKQSIAIVQMKNTDLKDEYGEEVPGLAFLSIFPKLSTKTGMTETQSNMFTKIIIHLNKNWQLIVCVRKLVRGHSELRARCLR